MVCAVYVVVAAIAVAFFSRKHAFFIRIVFTIYSGTLKIHQVRQAAQNRICWYLNAYLHVNSVGVSFSFFSCECFYLVH